MANRDDHLAVDLELLDIFDSNKNGYVPEHKEKKKFEAPKLIIPKTVSKEEAKKQAAESRLKALISGVVIFAFFAIVGSVVYSNAYLADKQYELQSLKSQLETAESDNVRLHVEFNSMLSSDKVEDYALTELGMVPKESYQISYFDMSEDTQTAETAE